MRGRRTLLCMIMLFIFAPFAFAQKEFGTIKGKVADIEALPIPGVVLIASSPSLIGGRATVYTDDGEAAGAT